MHNTIASNTGGDGSGIYVADSTDVTLTNNIIVNHALGINNDDVGGSTVIASYTLFEGNTVNVGPGVASSSVVPGPAGLMLDFHLLNTSGAIDQGTPVGWVSHDIDSEIRPIGAGIDIGADEAWLWLFQPLVLRAY